MLSRVAAVKAPRTHNRRRVTGSSGRRREGRESERQRPNMSRHHFYSAVLLLLVMMCCGSGASGAEVKQSSDSKFVWSDVNDDITVDSLAVPCLLNVESDVFAVAEAQCKKKDEDTVLTGIASQLLTMEEGKERIEVLQDAKKHTQVLEEVTSTEQKKRVDVSRPTAVVEGGNIYMLVGKHSHEGAANCKSTAEKTKRGILLVRGQVGGEKKQKIHWNYTDGLPCIIGGQHNSLTQLIVGGGSGVRLRDGTFLFPVEATNKKEREKDVKSASLIIHNSADNPSWNLSKGMSADGCSDPSVVEWQGKVMMMTACDDGRRRVYEIGDKGESWTEALGTLSRVWGDKHKRHERGVGSGFITATFDGVGGKKKVMLVTLPVYPKEKQGNGKGELHLWLTDNTHIVDIGPVSGKDDDAAASSLLYKSGNNDELIALYEKKKAGGEENKPSLGMASVLLTAELKRVKEVLTTWKKVDDRVSHLCPRSSATVSTSTGTACSAGQITAGLVGFLSGNFSDNTWRDEYLGVNATVKGGAEMGNGVKFTGRGAWAEWPVGSQGENQLYHFANYNFTLVATVSIHNVPKGDSAPLIGVKMNDNDKTVLLGLSYNKERKWERLCSGGNPKEHSSSWDPETTYQLAIVLQNGTQVSVYVDGKRVGNEGCALENTRSKQISHFYIGGDGDNTKSQGVSVTVENVLLYNRPLNGNEIIALNAIKDPILKPEDRNKLAAGTLSPEGSEAGAEGAVLQSTLGRSQRMEQELLKRVGGADGRGVSGAASTAATSSSNDGQTVAAESGDTMQGEGIQSQVREVNATAPNSSLGNSSWGNNTGDGSTVCGSGLLPLLLLLGLWGFASL
ncbi:trans-sialidase, putative [Trypanosoma cruzi marinkellei]|uniref:Trans-sialidase, putative n=1 Tax=Trypanosoma cruzi marinkellei TaxID=85056 RepID=K2MVG8_TRYCR|nr:trans-sialidase, putative [Trypanosoma cruzi marinkellei]